MRSLIGLIILVSHQLSFAKVIAEPVDCKIGVDAVCGIRSLTRELFDGENYQIITSSEASFVTESSSKIRYLSGSILVSTKVQISFLFAAQEILINGDVLIIQEKSNTVSLYNLDAQLESKSSILRQEFLPLPGLKTKLMYPATLAQLKVGFPEPTSQHELLAGLSDLGLKGVIKSRAKIYLANTQKSSQLASELYASVVTRRIASIKEQEELDRKNAEARRQELQRLRKLFREKNYLD